MGKGQIDVLYYEKSSRGRTMLNHNGYSFTLNRQRGDKKYWECIKRRTQTINCKSRIVTIGLNLKCVTAPHNHT